MLSSEIINSLLRLLFAFVLGEFVLLSKNKLIANTSLRLALRFLIVIWCYIFFTKNLGLGLLVCSIRLGLNLLFLSSKKMANHFARNLMRIEILLSFIFILVVWGIYYSKSISVKSLYNSLFYDNKLLLVILGYILVLWPSSLFVGYFTDRLILSKNTAFSANMNPNISKQSQWIGLFERMIILTLVLNVQYEAIGFLITGKSIIRFSGKDSRIMSEYILVGTLMSYTIAIMAGVLINYILGRLF